MAFSEAAEDVQVSHGSETQGQIQVLLRRSWLESGWEAKVSGQNWPKKWLNDCYKLFNIRDPKVGSCEQQLQRAQALSGGARLSKNVRLWKMWSPNKL